MVDVLNWCFQDGLHTIGTMIFCGGFCTWTVELVSAWKGTD